jgi:tetratricopeptide (TPR) repeat protein
MRITVAVVVCAIALPVAAAELSAVQALEAGLTYADSGSARKAVPLLKRALDSKKLDAKQQARAHLGLGMCHAQLEQPDQVVKQLEQAIALDPKLAKAYLLLGMTHDLGDQLPQALAAYRRGVAALPDDAELLHGLGLAELSAGEVAAAVEHLRAAQKHKPHDTALAGDLGYAQLRAGQFEAAIGSLNEALVDDLGRGDGASGSDLYTYLGDAHAGKNDLQRALDAYDRALEIDPAKTRARFHKGLVLSQKGDLAGAMGCFRAVLRSEPKNLRAQLELGAALARTGGSSTEEAERTLRAVLQQDPSYSDAYVELARIAVGRGDLAVARRLLEQALERRPDDERALEALDQLLGQTKDAAAQAKVREKLKQLKQPPAKERRK